MFTGLPTVGEQRKALAEHIGSIVPDAVVLPPIGHKITDVFKLEPLQRLEQRRQHAEMALIAALNQVHQIVPHFDLDEGAVLEHIEGIIRRLETSVPARVLHRQSRPVIHPTIKAQRLGLVQKASV